MSVIRNTARGPSIDDLGCCFFCGLAEWVARVRDCNLEGDVIFTFVEDAKGNLVVENLADQFEKILFPRRGIPGSGR